MIDNASPASPLASDDPALEQFFRDCFASTDQQSEQISARPWPKCEREWNPATVAPGTLPAEIIRRHPQFTFAFEDLPEIKIRQAMRGGRRSRFGKFSSRKMRRSMRAYSDLEFDCIRWLEFDPEVESYLEQPVIMRYPFQGRWRLHKPDFFYRTATGDGFIEVKPEQRASRPELEEKYAAIGQSVSSLGFSYQVLTETQVRHQPAFGTLLHLFLRNRWTPLPDEQCLAKIQEALDSADLPILQLEMLVPGVSDDQLRALVLRGFLRVDLSRPLGPRSLVCLTGRPPVSHTRIIR